MTTELTWIWDNFDQYDNDEVIPYCLLDAERKPKTATV